MKIQRAAIVLLLFVSFLVNGQESATNDVPSSAKPQERLKAFQFDGGQMGSFIEAINKYFKIELRSFADIPTSMLRVHVPKMRVPNPANFASVLNLYNSVSSEGRHELGMWIIKGQEVEGKPGAVLLTRGTSSKDGGTMNVRAFSCKGFDQSKVESFIKEVQLSSRRLASELQRVVEPEQFDGTIDYHSETGILLAVGSDQYLKLVEELLQAFKEQAQESATKDAKADKK